MFQCFFSNFVCQSSNVRLGQFGVYDLVIPDASGSSGSSLPECDFRTALEPVDANIAILYCALILVAIGIVYQVTTLFKAMVPKSLIVLPLKGNIFFSVKRPSFCISAHKMFPGLRVSQSKTFVQSDSKNNLENSKTDWI